MHRTLRVGSSPEKEVALGRMAPHQKINSETRAFCYVVCLREVVPKGERPMEQGKREILKRLCLRLVTTMIHDHESNATAVSEELCRIFFTTDNPKDGKRDR